MSEAPGGRAQGERGAARPTRDSSLTTLFWEEFWPLASPLGPLPDPTPSEGPDPYGNPEPEWLRIDWRRHLRRVEVGGAQVTYAELGEPSGLDLVLVHGLGGCWQNWLENIPHLARERRVIALDLPGFGASPLPPWELTVEAYGRFLHEFCAAVGVGDCAVIGNSMGGFVAAQAAIAEPERFEKLVLVSSAGISNAKLRRRPAETLARFTAITGPLWLRLGNRALRRPRLRHNAFNQIFYNPSKLRTELLFEFFRNGTHRPGFMPAVRALIGYEIAEHLERVEVPTLIVWGRQDHVVPATDAAELGRLLRNSQTVILDRCGHCPMAERPVRFNRILDSFIPT